MDWRHKHWYLGPLGSDSRGRVSGCQGSVLPCNQIVIHDDRSSWDMWHFPQFSLFSLHSSFLVPLHRWNSHLKQKINDNTCKWKTKCDIIKNSGSPADKTLCINRNMFWNKSMKIIHNSPPGIYCHIWAILWQNQQNDLCAQRRLRSAWASTQSD